MFVAPAHRRTGASAYRRTGVPAVMLTWLMQFLRMAALQRLDRTPSVVLAPHAQRFSEQVCRLLCICETNGPGNPHAPSIRITAVRPAGGTQPMTRAIFLDKDGTLIPNVAHNVDPDLIRLHPFAARGLKLLQQRGYALFVVSNPSGVAHGLFDEEALKAVEKRIDALLAREQVVVAGHYFCPHHPAGNVAGRLQDGAGQQRLRNRMEPLAAAPAASDHIQCVPRSRSDPAGRFCALRCRAWFRPDAVPRAARIRKVRIPPGGCKAS
jgi:HAD superfamily hydrolase (TIGR01662 family)